MSRRNGRLRRCGIRMSCAGSAIVSGTDNGCMPTFLEYALTRAEWQAAGE